MVDEVNRLVGNLLAAGSGVFLPGVGRSLSSGAVPSGFPNALSSLLAAWYPSLRSSRGYRLPMNWHVRCTATLPEHRMFTTAGFPARARATC